MNHKFKRWIQLNPIYRLPKVFCLRAAATKRYMRKSGYSLRKAWEYSGLVIS
jgi:hypothetical protein